MKKKIKNSIIIISVIIIMILLDTIQAIIFKNSPVLSLRDIYKDNTSYVDRGILINTYYCVQEQDIVTVSWHFKTAKYSCPIDNVFELNEAKGVSMSIKEGTLTNSSATIIIKDISNKDHIYGNEYRIDKLENGTWKELDVIVEGNYGWTSIGYHVDKDNKLELNINWKWLYGELTEGTYRVVKSTSVPRENKEYYFSVEFKLD